MLPPRIVIVLGSCPHRQRFRGADAEAKPGGCEPLQVAGIGEEGEDLFSGQGQVGGDGKGLGQGHRWDTFWMRRTS